MAVAAAIIGAVAAVVGTVSTIQAAEAQAEQAEREASLKNQQAEEIKKRQQINEQVLRRRALQLEASQQTKFAAAGVDISTGAPLQLLAQVYDDLELDIQSARREAMFNSYVLGEESSGLRSLAGGTRSLGYAKGGSTLLGGLASSYQIKDPKPGGTKPNPSGGTD